MYLFIYMFLSESFPLSLLFFFFFLKDPATPEIYPLPLHDALPIFRDVAAARDAAEDVEENRAHAGVGRDDPERGHALLGIRAAADVEKVGRLTAVVLDQVHRGHREPGAVDAAADGAVQLDEGQAGLAGCDLGGRFGLWIAQRRDLGSPFELVVVHHDL